MKIRSKAVGQYKGSMVYIGDIIEIDAAHYLPSWMEEIVEPIPLPEMIEIKVEKVVEEPKIEKKKERFKIHFKVPYFEITIGGNHES